VCVVGGAKSIVGGAKSIVGGARGPCRLPPVTPCGRREKRETGERVGRYGETGALAMCV